MCTVRVLLQLEQCIDRLRMVTTAKRGLALEVRLVFVLECVLSLFVVLFIER
jgi:hypothetical protein